MVHRTEIKQSWIKLCVSDGKKKSEWTELLFIYLTYAFDWFIPFCLLSKHFLREQRSNTKAWERTKIKCSCLCFLRSSAVPFDWVAYKPCRSIQLFPFETLIFAWRLKWVWALVVSSGAESTNRTCGNFDERTHCDSISIKQNVCGNASTMHLNHATADTSYTNVNVFSKAKRRWNAIYKSLDNASLGEVKSTLFNRKL